MEDKKNLSVAFSMQKQARKKAIKKGEPLGAPEMMAEGGEISCNDPAHAHLMAAPDMDASIVDQIMNRRKMAKGGEIPADPIEEEPSELPELEEEAMPDSSDMIGQIRHKAKMKARLK